MIASPSPSCNSRTRSAASFRTWPFHFGHVYVLAAIIKKELALDVSLYTFLQILSVHSFEKLNWDRRFSMARPIRLSRLLPTR
jgi:hypothetical protein